MFRYRSKAKKPVRGRAVPWRPETIMILKQLLIGVVSIATVSGLIYGIWYITRLPAMTISTIEVVGGYTITPEEVRQAALTPLNGEYLKLIPKTFAFLYSETDIIAAVSAIDKLKDPVVERVSLTTLRISIDEYIPYALWCEEREGGFCYYIDSDGVAFSPAPPLSGSAFVRYRTIGRAPVQFETLTDSEQLAAVGNVVALLEERFDFPVISVELDVVGDVFYILRGGSEIKVSKRLAVEETIRNLEAVLSAEEFQDLVPGNFPYIDLRFGNKVFVSDEWPVVESLATSTAVELPIPTLPAMSDVSASSSQAVEVVSEQDVSEEEAAVIVPIIVDPADRVVEESEAGSI